MNEPLLPSENIFTQKVSLCILPIQNGKHLLDKSLTLISSLPLLKQNDVLDIRLILFNIISKHEMP